MTLLFTMNSFFVADAEFLFLTRDFFFFFFFECLTMTVLIFRLDCVFALLVVSFSSLFLFDKVERADFGCGTFFGPFLLMMRPDV